MQLKGGPEALSADGHPSPILVLLVNKLSRDLSSGCSGKGQTRAAGQHDTEVLSLCRP